MSSDITLGTINIHCELALSKHRFPKVNTGARNPLMRTRVNLRLVINWRRDVIARSSALISSTGNLVSQYQHDITCTVKQIVLVGRPEALSLPGFIYKLSVIYQKPQNASEQNCSVC